VCSVRLERRSLASLGNGAPSEGEKGWIHVNCVSITARLVRDPDMVDPSRKTAVCNLRVAVERRGDGAVFVDVKTFGPQATACADYLSKGDPIAIVGRLELAEWQARDGSKRSRLYVIAERVEFLSRMARPRARREQAAAA
jgi:single-strand DNA-binding protein